MREGSPRPGEDEVQLGPLADFVGFHLRLAQEASYQAFARRCRAGDDHGVALKPGHFTLLTIIGHNPGLTQTALGRASGRDKSSLSPVLEDFERRGLMTRRRLDSDRRSYALCLTPAGEALQAEMMVHAAAHDGDLDGIVGADAAAALIGVLRRIRTELAGP